MCHLTLSVSHAPLVSYVSYNMVSSCFILLRTLQRARMSWKPMAPRSGHRWSLTRKIGEKSPKVKLVRTIIGQPPATAHWSPNKGDVERWNAALIPQDWTGYSNDFKIFEAHPHSRNTKKARGHQATQSLLEHRPWDLRKPGPSECQGLGVPSLISDFPAL